jgi:biopolymer transport protein ExbD
MQKKQVLAATTWVVMLAFAQLSIAQSPSTDPTVPTLRPGISVQLPVTHHAVTILDADKEDAVVIAVARNGEVYLGVTPTPPSALIEKLKGADTVYLKADANASYGNVQRVLGAIYGAGVKSLALLTSQPSSHPGTIAPPEGLEVIIGSSSSAANVVQVLRSHEPEARVLVGNTSVARNKLKTALAQLMQGQHQKTVLVEADSTLPVSDVVSVIDECSSAGATVALRASAD